MFNKFCSTFDGEYKGFNTDLNVGYPSILKHSVGAVEFMAKFQGKSFNNGLYRVHKINELDKWNDIVTEAFPYFKNNIFCFSYDWLGRQFALDFTRVFEGEPMIVMFEPGTGEALEIPSTFLSFHEEELIEFQEAALAVGFFNEWIKENTEPLDQNQCVGYKIPLFLGGEDEISNLDISDLEVYWGTIGQLMKQLF
jgi:hypothetical protein